MTTERSEMISEGRLTLRRMRDDLNLPGIPKTLNRLHHMIIRQTAMNDAEPTFRETKSEFDQGAILVDLRFPEMSFAYNYRRKENVHIPDSPEIFFSALDMVNDIRLQQEAVKRSEVLKLQKVFNDETIFLNGETPLLWVFAQECDIILQGLKIRSIDRLDSRVRRSISSQTARLPIGISRMSMINNLLLTGLYAYLSPERTNLLVEYAEDEYTYLLSCGVDLPRPPSHQEIQEYTPYVQDLLTGGDF